MRVLHVRSYFGHMLLVRQWGILILVLLLLGTFPKNAPRVVAAPMAGRPCGLIPAVPHWSYPPHMCT